ncbi:hypothetical protein [Nocardia alba]|nr:hypothetical protein [Nocardia alba]
MDIPGARSATLVDGASGLAVAGAGNRQNLDEHEDAAGTTDVVRVALGCRALASADDALTEIVVCRTRGFHLLHLIDGDFDGRLFMHVAFDGDIGNLGMARFQLRSALADLAGGKR